jgi:hypothetical protein
MPKRTISLELHDFFSYIGKGLKDSILKVTSSAFTQQRKKLSPDVFATMTLLLTDEFYCDNDERVKLWEGHRLLAIDGSKITLPYTEKLKQEFGCAKNQNQTDDVIQGRVSVLYDVLNEMAIDAVLTTPEQGEITLAHGHIKQIKAHDLLILDRGYPSFHLAFDILGEGADFLFRCKLEFNNITKAFIESGQTESLVEISPKQNGSFKGLPYKPTDQIMVRLIRIPLESGEIELLMTSLTDAEKYPTSLFKKLYFKRWGIETFYNRIKNILALENFSGLSSLAIQQDFHCAMFICNAQSLIIDEAQPRLKENCAGRKLEYKINTAVSLGFMKYHILDIFTKYTTDKALKEMEDLLITQLIPDQFKKLWGNLFFIF